MIKTPNLDLPIYDKPSTDTFKVADWNKANENIDYVFGELKNNPNVNAIDIKAREDIINNHRSVTEQLDNIAKNKWYFEKEKVVGETFNATLNKIIAKCSENDEIIIPFGTYIMDDSVVINKKIKLFFNNSTVTYNGVGIAFNSQFSIHNSFEIHDLRLVLQLNSSSTGIRLEKCKNGTLLKNVYVNGGSYGIYCINSYMYSFKKIEIYNPSVVGWYIQGDGGAEVKANDVYIGFSATNFVGGYGIEIERTTPTDKGGYYFNDVLVVNNNATGATSKSGWYIHSSVQNSIVVLCLTGGGSDGYLGNQSVNDVYGFKVVNCVNFKINNAWITSFNFTRCEDFIANTINNPYGIYLEGASSLVNAQLSNFSSAEDTFLKYKDASTTTGDIYYSNIRTPLLTNDFSKLYSKDKNKILRVYSSPSSQSDCFRITNQNDDTKSTYMRVQNDGTFELLNQRFESMLQFFPNGAIKRGGRNIVNLPKSFTMPTGDEYRGEWDTSTVTTQQLAKVLKALLVDLKSWHGLID